MKIKRVKAEVTYNVEGLTEHEVFIILSGLSSVDGDLFYPETKATAARLYAELREAYNTPNAP